MGILGTSYQEEDALRAAAAPMGIQRLESKYSTDMSTSSAYETASDAELEDMVVPGRDNAPDADDVSTILGAALNIDHGDTHDLGQSHGSVLQEKLTNSSGELANDSGGNVGSISDEALTGPVRVADLDFDGPDDPANPFNWPTWKKWFITLTTSNACLCISLGSSLYVEGVPEIMVSFGSSQTLALAGLTLYLVGLALGPVIAAPMSEVMGRRLIYVTTFPASMLFTMGVGLSQNMRSILVLRFMSGLLASPPMSIASGSISDLWANDPKDMYAAVGLFCLAPFLGPVIGPIIGGFVAENKSWRWTMWVSLMFSGAVLPCLLLCPETYKPAILKARAKKRGIALVEETFSLKEALIAYLLRPIEMLFVEPLVGLSSIYIAFVFAVLFGFFEAFPIIFRGVYTMGTGVSGLPFLAVGIGLSAGVAVFIIMSNINFNKAEKSTEPKVHDPDAPEKSLSIAQVGAFLIPVGLFWLAWSSRKLVHWIVPTLAGLPFGFGLVWIFLGIVLYYSWSFPPAYVASALAANNLIRYLLASVFPLFTVQMYQKLHIGWATSLLGFIAVAMVPIPFAFRKYGRKLRGISKYGYAAAMKKKALESAQEEGKPEQNLLGRSRSADVAHQV